MQQTKQPLQPTTDKKSTWEITDKNKIKLSEIIFVSRSALVEINRRCHRSSTERVCYSENIMEMILDQKQITQSPLTKQNFTSQIIDRNSSNPSLFISVNELWFGQNKP